MEKEKGEVGFQMDRSNYERSPPGTIRIARFTTAFCPKHNLGYYSEVYLHIMIRKWKRQRLERNNQKKEPNENKPCNDTENIILNFYTLDN